jgi:hypothetical protein
MLAELPPRGTIAVRVGAQLAPVLYVGAHDSAAALEVVERMQPGVALWQALWKNVDPDRPGTPARVRELMEESRPPWAKRQR